MITDAPTSKLDKMFILLFLSIKANVVKPTNKLKYF